MADALLFLIFSQLTCQFIKGAREKVYDGKALECEEFTLCSGTGAGRALPEATQSLRGKGRC